MSKTLKRLNNILSKKIIIATVGLSDPTDEVNKNNISNNIKNQIPKEFFEKMCFNYCINDIPFMIGEKMKKFTKCYRQS